MPNDHQVGKKEANLLTRPKLDQSAWLEKYAKKLSEYGDAFANGGPFVEYGPHTLLKLSCIAFYAPMFAMIAKGRSAQSKGYDAAVYLDLFAGPGLVKVDNKYGDLLAGSPIAATVESKFNYSVFVEIDPERASALEKRLSSFLPKDNFTVHTGDANLIVGKVISDVKARYKKPIVLAFIDPEGMEAKWKTAEALSAAFPSLDFMINMTAGAARVAGKVANNVPGIRPIFDDYFGPKADEVLTTFNAGGKVEAKYAEAIQNVLGKPLGETISICDKGDRVMYHLLAYTRQSLGGSDWAVGFKALKDRLTGLDGEKVDACLMVVKKRQESLADWFA